jgi:ATP-binding cassette subfamily B protein RaxB
MNAELQTGLIGGSRIRLIRQSEIAECGLACLAMVASHYGLDVDLGTLRRRYQPSMRGAALRSLMGTADAMGLSGRAVQLPLGALAHLHMPAILHWDLNHYVVLERVKQGALSRRGTARALIHNPDGRSQWMGIDELSKHFTGVALELRPTDDFVPADMRERLRLRQLWRRMTGLKRALAQTLILSLVMQTFVMTAPYFMQISIDSALPALDLNLVTVLALGFGLFALLNAAATLLRSFVLLSAGTSLSFGVTTNIVRRLLRLPVSWFEKRHVGDILSRFQSITPIQDALTQGAVAAVLDGSLAILTLVVMFFYSATLALIALVAFALYGLVRTISFSLQREAQQAKIIASAKEQSTLIESLRGVVTLRLFNREAARHALWQTRLVDSVNANLRASRIGIWQNLGNTTIFALETAVSMWVAISSVIAGGFSIGMMFAYFAYKEQFLSRAASLVDQGVAFRMLGLHLERLSDIALADEDASFRQGAPAGGEIKGHIELRNVSFRYSPSDPLVLDDLNLEVQPGDHIGITGPSGGGKSTLVKIILGLLEPDSGEILIDGVALGRFGYQNYREAVGAVMQDDSLFAGSLADNIALFDDAPDLERIMTAATDAAIHDDIEQMPMRYETLVGDMGSTLSGGQKQRVLLARALYRRPRILVMDEGTSHVDSSREAAINATIARLGITRIIIAHRAETILAATRVFQTDRGKLTEVSPRGLDRVATGSASLT